MQAFVVSRIVYIAPYAILKTSECNKLDALIRKAYKQALGLPISTSTEKLLGLGLHNTIDEIIEAHLTAQQQRLATTPTGRHLLRHLGYSVVNSGPDMEDIPEEIRENINVSPLPRNMHPQHHEG